MGWALQGDSQCSLPLFSILLVLFEFLIDGYGYYWSKVAASALVRLMTFCT